MTANSRSGDASSPANGCAAQPPRGRDASPALTAQLVELADVAGQHTFLAADCPALSAACRQAGSTVVAKFGGSSGGAFTGEWDRIIVPFSEDDDVAQTVRGFNHLKPGGVLVAVLRNAIDRHEFRAFTARLDEQAHPDHPIYWFFKTENKSRIILKIKLPLPKDPAKASVEQATSLSFPATSRKRATGQQDAIAIAEPEPLEPAFGGASEGRLVEFPSRQDAANYLAIQQSRPGFAQYETRIEKRGEKNFDMIYRKSAGGASVPASRSDCDAVVQQAEAVTRQLEQLVADSGTGVPPVCPAGVPPSEEAGKKATSFEANTNNEHPMKLRIKRTTLLSALAAVKSAATNRSQPVLANVALVANQSSVTLTATNLDLTLRARTDAVVEAKGDITVPCVLLHDIVRSVRGEDVFLELNRKTLHVACGGSKFKLATIATGDFPSVPRIKEPAEFELPQWQLRRMLASTAFAHGQDKERPVLNGALFALVNGGLSVVGCDGHRIAVAMLGAVKGRAQFVLPAAACSDLLRLLDGKKPEADADKDGEKPAAKSSLSASGDKAADGAACLCGRAGVRCLISAGSNGVQLSFTSSGTDYTLITKIIEGKYPDYQKVIPETKDGIAMGRADLLDAVERVALVGDTCRLEFRKQNLTIVSESKKSDCPGEAVESLLCPATKEATIRLEARFLREALAAVDADEVEFHVTAGPAVLKANGSLPWTAVIAAVKDKPDKREEPAKKPEPAKK